MKGNIKSFVSGCIVTAAVVGLVGSASATVGQKTVALDYNDIMISVNGQTIMPTDSNGNAVGYQRNHLSAGAGRGRSLGSRCRVGRGEKNGCSFWRGAKWNLNRQ